MQSRGRLIGLGVGVAVGALVGLTTTADKDAVFGNRETILAFSIGIFGSLGSGIGWGIGRLSKGEVWKRDRKFAPPQMTVTVLPGGRAGIGFSIATP